MKLKVNFGDDLKNAVITNFSRVPVTKNFGSNIIGFAELSHEGENTIAVIEIIDENEYKKIVNHIECGVGGRILQREGDIITKFKLDSVSIIAKL